MTLLALVLLGGLPALPAQAGGWAVPVLDPLPATVEADRTYTVGYWVLQHGTHPYEGTLEKTGLRLTGGGRVLEFEGRALPEPAHYAVAIAVPKGTWRVVATQGWFPEVEVGTLTVPGGLVRTPSEMEIDVSGPYWGAVRPPADAAGKPAGTRAGQPAAEPVQRLAPVAEATPAGSSGGPVLIAVAGLVVLLAAVLFVGPLRRRLRR